MQYYALLDITPVLNHKRKNVTNINDLTGFIRH